MIRRLLLRAWGALSFDLHTLTECFHFLHAQRKAAREIRAMLRAKGFVETAPGDWKEAEACQVHVKANSARGIDR